MKTTVNESIDNLRAASEKNPRDPKARYALGCALLDAGRLTEAAAELNQAVIIDPNDADALLALGRLAIRNRDFRGASVLLRQASESRPEWSSAYFQWAVALRGLGDAEGARSLQAKALELGIMEVRERNRTAGRLIEEGKFPEAVEELYSALAVSPRSAMSHVNMGAALKGLGRAKEARDWFEKAAALGPDIPEALYNLGLDIFMEDKFQEALDLFEKASRLKPEDPYSRNAAGNALSRLGRHAEAIPRFEEAFERKPDFAEALNGLGESLIVAGDHTRAAKVLSDALFFKPDFHRARMNLGRALERKGGLDGAVAAYLEVARRQKDNVQAPMNAARVEMGRGRPVEAVRILEAARSACGDLPEIMFLLARACLEAGKDRDAASILRGLLERDPASYDGWKMLADAMIDAGDADASAKALRKAASLKPGETRLLVKIADVFTAAGRAEDAEAALRDALKADPSDVDTINRLSVVLEAKGDLPGAVWALEAAASTGEPDLALVEKLVDLSVRAGRSDKAVPHSDVAIALGGDERKFRAIKAAALESLGQRKQAESEWRKLLKKDPGDGQAHAELGKLLVKQGTFAAGASELQAALALGAGGRDMEAMCFLGLALSETGRTEGAIRVLSKALEIDPGFGPIHNVLAGIYHAMGEYQSAWAHVGFAATGGSPVEPELVHDIRRHLEV